MKGFVEISCVFTISSRDVERVGIPYLYSKKKTISSAELLRRVSEKSTIDEINVDITYLKSLDPKEWKNQDHYAVLGLEKLRFHASDEDIRRAYRRMVLQHHPDKRKAKGEEVKTDDDYFTCITKAYEILGTSKTRRAYDSVDPQFDDSLPSQNDIENNFYGIFNKYFDLNKRWSERKNVPSFGGENSLRSEVEEFYTFWYEFKSWREFSYLDEEDKEKGQDREERRWIEKENKAARIKRKKEEMIRVRALVDLAYNNDKRIQKFKNEEKERKLAMKRAKMDAVQAQKAEQERVLKEAQLLKERAEKDEQKRIEQIRIEKEQLKKALKKEKKTLRDKAKDFNYFSDNDKEVLKNMEGVEKICESLGLSELQQLNKEIETVGKSAFFAAIETVEKKAKSQPEATKTTKAFKTDVKEINKNDLWSGDNVQLLIKAVNLFPAGTSQRWDVIASFMNHHSTNEINVSARDVLNKAKALQSGDFSKSALKVQANKSAFESFEKSKKESNALSKAGSNNAEEISYDDRESIPQEKENLITTPFKQTLTPKIWTKEEQALLEQAIKTYPISTPDRWERIAECIPNRTKKDCLRRVKELVDLVNAKKEAQQSLK